LNGKNYYKKMIRTSWVFWYRC